MADTQNTPPPSKPSTLPPKSDLTQGSIWRHIFSIGLPAMVGYFFNTLYNWVDTFWGGKIAIEALAAFSLSFPPFLLSIALGQGLASGGMVIVSNALGAKNLSDARYYMKQVVFLATIAGIMMLGLIWIIGKDLLVLLGAQDQTLVYALQYLRTLSFGLPFMMIFFALNISLTSQGNTKFMRNVLIMNTLINLGLDPLLMYGINIGGIQIIPSLGVVGIALATVIVQVIGVILAWIKIQSDETTHWRSEGSNAIEHPKFDWQATKQIIKYGFPTFLQIGMAVIGLAVVNYFLAKITGKVAVAGYGIGLRVEQLALVPTIGFGMALSAIAGQNNGAKKFGRVKETFLKLNLLALVLWLGMMLPIAIFGNQVARIFTTDLQTAQVAYFYLSFAFLAFMGYQFMGSSSGMLQAMKKPLIPMLVLTARQLVLPWIFIPIFAYALDWGIYGIFTSVVISVWISALLLIILSMRLLHKQIKAAASE